MARSHRVTHNDQHQIYYILNNGVAVYGIRTYEAYHTVHTSRNIYYVVYNLSSMILPMSYGC